MVRVVGPLRVVTDRPLLVSQVRVRAARDRAERGGLTAAFSDTVTVEGGRLDMVVLPGPAVLDVAVTGGHSHVVRLVVPDVAEATLEQCVLAAEIAGEADKRTLERLAGEVARDALAASGSAESASESASEAVTQAQAAGSSASAAAESASAAGQAKAGAAGSAEEAAESAKSAATSEQNAGTHAATAAQHEVAASGHADTAKREADRAATIAGSTRWVGTQLEVNGELSPDLKGDKGDKGDPGRDGASSWEGITDKPEAFTPAAHSHEIGDVNGLLAQFGARGNAPTAEGGSSTALGDSAAAMGEQSAAIGYGASAANPRDTALGSGAAAEGGSSMALGYGAAAMGEQSTAIGSGAFAAGDTSQAITTYSTATKDGHTVIGLHATDKNIPTDVQGTVVVGKTGAPIYLAGRDVLAELDTGLAEARAYTDALIVVGYTSARDGKLHIVYE